MVAPPEDTRAAFQIDYSYRQTDYPDWKDHRLVIPVPPMLFRTLNEEQKVSKDPLPLGSLEDVTYDLSMKFPQGYKPIVPQRVEQKEKFAEFTANYSLENDVLNGVFHLKTLALEIPGTERAAFSNLAKVIDEAMRRYDVIFMSFRGPQALKGSYVKPFP